MAEKKKYVELNIDKPLGIVKGENSVSAYFTARGGFKFVVTKVTKGKTVLTGISKITEVPKVIKDDKIVAEVLEAFTKQW